MTRRRPSAWLRPMRRCCRCGEVIGAVPVGGPAENIYGGAYCRACAREMVLRPAVRGLRDTEDEPAAGGRP